MSEEPSGFGEILWHPSPARVGVSHMADFARRAALATADYASLHAWSIAHTEAFHKYLWDRMGIIGEQGLRIVESHAELRKTRFFPDALLNYAENLLVDPDNSLAIAAHREDGTRRLLTRHQLYGLVSQAVRALRSEGVGPGDRVAALATSDLEAVIAFLATSAVGAVWAACPPDLGPAVASERLNQLQPKLLLAVPTCQHGGKTVDIAASIEAVAAARSVEKIVLLGSAPARAFAKPVTPWQDWLSPFDPSEIAFERLPFDAPLAILFSSVATGKPQGIVHGAGRLLLQHRKEHVLHCDLSPGDTLFYDTTGGTMMWHWLVSGLASRLTIVTFDGDPFFPQPGRMADLIDRNSVTVFGASASFLGTCAWSGLKPRVTHSLQSLRTILAGGAPLPPHVFDYIYRDWKARLHLAPICGSAQAGGCLLGLIPVWPVHRGEAQGPLLGLDLAVLAPNGAVLQSGAGELVCRNAFLSMPVGFWNDDSGAAYERACFSRFPPFWAEGVRAERRPSGGFVLPA